MITIALANSICRLSLPQVSLWLKVLPCSVFLLAVMIERLAVKPADSGLGKLWRLPAKLPWLLVYLWEDCFGKHTGRDTIFPGGLKPSRARFWELAELAAFDHAVFPKQTPWLATVFYLLRLRLSSGAALFVLRDPASSNRIIGTAYLRRLYGTRTGFISNVGTHPDYRQRGIARHMMTRLILPEATRQQLTRLVLNVGAPDTHVQRFYKQLGFNHFEGKVFDIAVPPDERPMFMHPTA